MEISSGPIANNGLIVSRYDELRLDCISNSSHTEVGTIITPSGDILMPGNYTGVVNLAYPFNRPGILRLRTIQRIYSQSSPLPESHKGIYTCTIPDNNGHEISLNVGLYPVGFNGELSLCIIAKR